MIKTQTAQGSSLPCEGKMMMMMMMMSLTLAMEMGGGSPQTNFGRERMTALFRELARRFMHRTLPGTSPAIHAFGGRDRWAGAPGPKQHHKHYRSSTIIGVAGAGPLSKPMPVLLLRLRTYKRKLVGNYLPRKERVQTG